MTAAIACPPSTEWEQFLLGCTDDERAVALETHLAECNTCGQRLVQLTAVDEVIVSLRIGFSTALKSDASLSLFVPVSESLLSRVIPQYKQIASSLDETQHPSSNGTSVAGDTRFDQTFVTGNATSATNDPNRLGRYTIEGVLGRGGMGTVLRAFDPLLQRVVAIKVMQVELLAEPGAAERLMSEARAAAAVEHDHIVPIFSVETYEGRPAIIMPMLRGRTLAEHIKEQNGPLAIPELLRIASEATQGLAAAHARGLIHCDIKPGNIWLESPHGRVRLLDFGLAIGRHDGMASSAGISGTPGYLAPEQAQGGTLDVRTDLFSLGCVLYLLATGRPAFTGERRTRALWTVTGEKPASAKSLNSDIPEALSDLIDRLLERDPAARPGSANDVLAALATIDRHIVEAATRRVRRRWFAGMLGMALLGGVVVSLWSWSAIPREPDPVAITFSGEPAPLAIVLHRDGKDEALELNGDITHALKPGEYLVRPATEQPGRTLIPDRFTVEATVPRTIRFAWVGELARHATHTQPVTGVAVSPGPDSLRVYSVGFDRALVMWNPPDARTPPRGVVPPPSFADLPHRARCVAVSPDGKTVATAGGNKVPPIELAIHFWDATRLERQREPFVGHTRLLNALQYTPDGKHLVSAGAEGVFVWNIATGTHERLVEQREPLLQTLVISHDGKRLLTAGDGGAWSLWDLKSKQVVQSGTAESDTIRAVGFCKKGFLTAGDDGCVRHWDDAGKLVRTVTRQETGILCLGVLADGEQVVVGDAAGEIRVWCVTDTAVSYRLASLPRAVQTLSLFPKGRRCVSGSSDGTVRLWQLPF